MMVVDAPYTTLLGHGLGMVAETRSLLELWIEGIEASELYELALASGRFSQVSARRLKNIVKDCFAPRFMVDHGRPARILQLVSPALTNREFDQLLFVYTCRANPILRDFICKIYWGAYQSGRDAVTNDQAREFVRIAVSNGLTNKPWPEGTIRRVASNLSGCCGDFGLLEGGAKSSRRILPFSIQPRTLIVLAYDLHFSGLGDNQMLASDDWHLFGLERDDVLAELKRQALQSKVIVQSAGAITKISWLFKSVEEISDVVA